MSLSSFLHAWCGIVGCLSGLEERAVLPSCSHLDIDRFSKACRVLVEGVELAT